MLQQKKVLFFYPKMNKFKSSKQAYNTYNTD